MWRRGTRVSWLSLKSKVDGLSLVWHQNHLDGFLQFALKTNGNSFSQFGLKTKVVEGFLVWVLKPAATVW
jgi:hypothetical protein